MIEFLHTMQIPDFVDFEVAQGQAGRRKANIHHQ